MPAVSAIDRNFGLEAKVADVEHLPVFDARNAAVLVPRIARRPCRRLVLEISPALVREEPHRVPALDRIARGRFCALKLHEELMARPGAEPFSSAIQHIVELRLTPGARAARKLQFRHERGAAVVCE